MAEQEPSLDRSKEAISKLDYLLTQVQDIGTITEDLRDEGFLPNDVEIALKSRGFDVKKEESAQEIKLSVSQLDSGGQPGFGFPKEISWKN